MHRLLRVLLLALLCCGLALAQNDIFFVTPDTEVATDHDTDTFADGSFVTCYERVPEGGSEQVHCTVVGTGNTVETEPFLVLNMSNSFDPCVAALSDDTFVVGFETRESENASIGMHARIFNKMGEPQGDLIEVQPPADGTSPGNCDVAHYGEDGQYIFAWHSQSTEDDAAADIKAVLYLDSAPASAEFMLTDSGANTNPSVAAVWVPDPDDGDNTTEPTGAWHFVVAYQKTDNDTDGSAVFARMLADDLTFEGDEWMVNEEDAGSQNFPVAASLHEPGLPEVDSLFAIMYFSNEDDDESADVRIKLYGRDNSSSLISHELAAGSGMRPEEPSYVGDMELLEGGDLVACWLDQDDDDEIIVCRVYQRTDGGEEDNLEDDFAQTSLFNPVPDADPNARRPRLSALPVADGAEFQDFLVTWEQDGDPRRIQASRLSEIPDDSDPGDGDGAASTLSAFWLNF